MPIDSKIRSIIKGVGHIKIDDMMREVLSLNSASYYKSVKNIGESGDFITAPEVSQTFGEVIALWAIEKWRQIGSPESFVLVELGPGEGKLMRDFLRTAKLVPKFFQGAQIYLLDINPHFMKKQKVNLSSYDKDVKWISKIKQIPNEPTILIANEFFDALPIKQYMKVKDTWFESMLVIEPADGRIRYDKVQLNKTLQSQLLLDHPEAKDGAIIEESLESLEIVRSLGKHIGAHGGAALIIDYGYDIATKIRTRRQYNSTLQAIKDHQYRSMIDTLGEADLTAHVDFNAIIDAFLQNGIKETNISSQKEFLVKYGITLRIDVLKKYASKEECEILDRQLFRLTDKGQMGELFKVLEVYKILA